MSLARPARLNPLSNGEGPAGGRGAGRGGHRLGVSIPSQTGRALQALAAKVASKLGLKSQSPLKRGGPCRTGQILALQVELDQSQSPLKRGGPCRPPFNPKFPAASEKSQSPLKRGGPCRIIILGGPLAAFLPSLNPLSNGEGPAGISSFILGSSIIVASQSPLKRGGPCRVMNVLNRLPFMEESQSPLKRGGPCREREKEWTTSSISSLNPLSNGEGPAGPFFPTLPRARRKVSIPSQTGRALQERQPSEAHQGHGRVSIPSQTGRALQAAQGLGVPLRHHAGVSIPSQTGRALQGGSAASTERARFRSQSPLKRGGPCRETADSRDLALAGNVSIPSQTGRALQASFPSLHAIRTSGVSIPSQTGRALQVTDKVTGVDFISYTSQSPLKRGGPCRAPSLNESMGWDLPSLNPLSNGEGPAGAETSTMETYRTSESQSPLKRGGPCRTTY